MVNKSGEKDFLATTDVEIKTASGQLVRATCCYDKKEEIKKWFLENIKEIEMPETRKISEIGHGSYGFYSRYNVKQHKYAGGGYPGCGGYIEVLAIQDPPENRHPIIIHVDKSGISTFYEITDLLTALDLFNKTMHDLFEGITPHGVIRKVVCGWFKPWFYAVGNQSLCGDYVFPDNIGIDDPIFRYPNKFIVSSGGITEIKTCIALTETKEKGIRDDREIIQHTAWWTDGTCTSWYSDDSYEKPKILEEKELWIQEAMDAFRQLLSGEISGFDVNNNNRKITVKIESCRNKSNQKIKTKKRKKKEPKKIIEITNEESWSGTFPSLFDYV